MSVVPPCVVEVVVLGDLVVDAHLVPVVVTPLAGRGVGEQDVELGRLEGKVLEPHHHLVHPDRHVGAPPQLESASDVEVAGAGVGVHVGPGHTSEVVSRIEGYHQLLVGLDDQVHLGGVPALEPEGTRVGGVVGGRGGGVVVADVVEQKLALGAFSGVGAEEVGLPVVGGVDHVAFVEGGVDGEDLPVAGGLGEADIPQVDPPAVVVGEGVGVVDEELPGRLDGHLEVGGSLVKDDVAGILHPGELAVHTGVEAGRHLDRWGQVDLDVRACTGGRRTYPLVYPDVEPVPCVKGRVCSDPPAPAEPVAVEILKPVLDIFLATAFDQPLVHVGASREGLNDRSLVDEGLDPEGGMGGDIEVDGDLDGGADDDGAEVGDDVVGGALGVVVPGGVADVVEVGVDGPVVDGAAGQFEPEAVAVRDGVGHLDRYLDVVGRVFVELHCVLEGGVVGQPQGHGHCVGAGRDGVDPLESLQGDQGVVVQAVY